MTKLLVKNHTLKFNGKTYRCAIGKGGLKKDKREGDACTPVGQFFLRELLYRADRIERPQTILPVSIIQETDGWCDAPQDVNYNRRVRLPYPATHENLWRHDNIYDLVVPFGYNDMPAIPEKGSAIFLHVARPDYSETDGCVALAVADLSEILCSIKEQAAIIIQQ